MTTFYQIGLLVALIIFIGILILDMYCRISKNKIKLCVLVSNKYWNLTFGSSLMLIGIFASFIIGLI